MGPLHRLRERAPRSEMFGVAVANGVPLAGVLALGWDAAALVTLYWVELGVLCLFALVRATFAGRPSEFDGDPLVLGALARRSASLSLPGTGVAVRLSTLPVVVTAAPLLALVWLFAGAITVGVVGTGTVDDRTAATLGLAVVTIVASEAGATLLDYFHRGDYRDHSAQTAIRGVLFRAMALAFGGLFTVMAVGLASDTVATDEPIGAIDPGLVGTPVLVAVVLVKLGVDLAGVYRDRLVAFDESQTLSLVWAYEPPTEESVDASLAADATRVRPTLRGRLLGGLEHVRHHPAAWGVGAVPALLGALFLTGGAWGVTAALLAAAVLLPLLLASADYWLRYGPVEYRTDGDAVVARDRLFDCPLWRVEAWDESDLRVERDWLDDRLGTATVVVERRDETLRLPRLADPEPILDAFDRRADRPDE